MSNIRTPLHTEIHNWTDSFGFRLNTSDSKNNVTTNHYFFETFNFIEKQSNSNPESAKFMCFDTYGEQVKVKSLLDLQSAFFDNISQLK